MKKGNIGNIILFVFILMIVLFIGVVAAFGGLVINWIFDIATPELSNLGQVGDTNLTEVAGYTVVPVNNVVQSFTWLSGVLYALSLVGLLGLSFAFRFTGNKWLASFFIACMLLVVIASIFISNIYEEFYNQTDDIGTMLHEQELLSYLVLYSPIVICVIGFIGGIIMFTGDGEEQTTT